MLIVEILSSIKCRKDIDKLSHQQRLQRKKNLESRCILRFVAKAGTEEFIVI